MSLLIAETVDFKQLYNYSLTITIINNLNSIIMVLL